MREILAAILALCVTSSISFGQESNRRSISTQGDATVYVVPDQAEISIGVETWAPALADAKSANDDAAKSAVAAVKQLGVDEKKISTSDVEVNIDYSPNGTHHQIEGYFVRRGYVIKLEDISLVSKVVDAALSNGANEISGVTFTSTQLRKYKDQARKMAAKAAREKASDLASALDAAIGPVRTINETSGIRGYYWGGYNRYSGGGFGGYGGQNAVSQAGGQNAAGGDETTPPGQIAIQASVSATFDLQDPAATPSK